MIPMTLALLAAAVVVIPSAPRVTGRLRRTSSDLTADASPSVPADPLAVAGAFDLLAACLRSGLDLATAAAAVATCAPDTLARNLIRASDLSRLGADPVAAWESVADDPETESLARMARRSARSGASLADAISELALERRSDAEDAAAAAAERAGVLIAGPLGLCFLPAFLALGIVPVVIGLARTVLSGGLL